MQKVKFILRTDIVITISPKIRLLWRIRTVFGFLSWSDFWKLYSAYGVNQIYYDCYHDGTFRKD